MKVTTNVPPAMMANIVMVMIQLTYDEFILFCEEPAVKAKNIHYEPLAIRDEINNIYRTLKNRMRDRMGFEGELHYNAMLAQIADETDQLQEMIDELHAKYRAAIVQHLPWQWQMPLIYGALAFYFAWNAQEAAMMLGHDRTPSQPLTNIIKLLDGITVRYDIPEWKPLQDTLRREWVQPIIDKVIQMAYSNFVIPDHKPVPVRKTASTDRLHASLDSMIAGERKEVAHA